MVTLWKPVPSPPASLFHRWLPSALRFPKQSRDVNAMARSTPAVPWMPSQRPTLCGRLSCPSAEQRETRETGAEEEQRWWVCRAMTDQQRCPGERAEEFTSHMTQIAACGGCKAFLDSRCIKPVTPLSESPELDRQSELL
ncbi:RNA 3'-terminal phosphate cyclase [Platysternon megacephalum]|uniref:RNA 3'-terminal phosphate cyclase n=1 Tax=Platysternon megacephalum TaxID=55544 RepID=A0A4D9DZY5_9SAUR|nr:RNA 3'-terminal phosphate cyclase [Platysternon megacephalum]